MAVIVARWLLPMVEGGEAIPDCFLMWDEDRGVITEVGRLRDLVEEDRQNAVEVDILTPGFVNSHAHLELSYGEMVPLNPGDSMADWLFGVIRKVMNGNPTYEGRKERSKRGILEMLQAGVTCINDISTDGASISAMEERGVRGVVSVEFFQPDEKFTGFSDKAVHLAVQRYRTLASSLGEETAGRPLSSSGRVRLGLSPHAPYNVCPEAWSYAVRECGEPFIHSHLAESRDEVDYVQGKDSAIHEMHQSVFKCCFPVNRPAESPVKYLAQAGLLDTGYPSPRIFAHGVFTTEEDRQIWAKGRLALAHCPRSNLYLQGETLKWSDWEDSGVLMGLGTDSHLSVPNLDIREDARKAMELHGWSAWTALEHLTRIGAQAVGLGGEIGQLRPGYQMDAVGWNLEKSGAVDDPAAVVLNPETQVKAAWVSGKALSLDATMGA